MKQDLHYMSYSIAQHRLNIRARTQVLKSAKLLHILIKRTFLKKNTRFGNIRNVISSIFINQFPLSIRSL